MASCINNQAFPAVSNISGNFLIQRSGRQLYSPTCYSSFLCLASIILKKILGLYCFTEQFRTYWSNTEAKVYRRYLEMFRKYSEHGFLLTIDLL